MSENENKKTDDVQFSEIEDKYTVDTDNSDAPKQEFTYSASDDTPPPPRGYSIASMTLGIISVVCCCAGMYPFLFFIPLLLGILAIVFRKIAKKKGANDGMMTAGLICGIIGIAISVIGFMFTIDRKSVV